MHASTMSTSEGIAAIAAALAKAQGEIETAKKDSENPHFRSKYADLASVWEACRSALSKNGIAVVQAPGTDETGAVTMTTMLSHSSGEWMCSTMACKPARNDAQSMGSVITYLRRYSLSAMVGVAPDEDDDGEAASGRGKADGRGRETNVAPATAALDQRTDPQDDPHAIANRIKHDIDAAADLAGINAVMNKAGARPGHPNAPITGSDLAKVQKHSAQAYKFLVDRADNRRSAFIGEQGQEAA